MTRFWNSPRQHHPYPPPIQSHPQNDRWNRFKFAVGSFWNRLNDWFDWMMPEAWNIEHNNRHHYCLSEMEDPDLVENNLEEIRKMDVSLIPKVELHVHFDGALANDLLYKHLTADCDISSLPNDVFLPWEPDKPLQVRSLLESCKSLSEFNCLCQCKGERSVNALLQCFEIFSPLVRGQFKLLEENAFSFVRNQSRQNVLYTEVRYSPHFLATIDASASTKVKLGEARAVVEAITSGLQRGCKEFGVVVNQLLCCINWRPEWADEVVELAKDFRDLPSCAVVGVDIAAGEEHFDSINFPSLHRPHYDAMQKAASLGIPVTLHAGENADPENVRKAVLKYGARRIGHGYRASDDPKFLKSVCVDRNIHFEVCPTSSLETGGWIGGGGAANWKKVRVSSRMRSLTSIVCIVHPTPNQLTPFRGAAPLGEDAEGKVQPVHKQ